MHLNGMRLQLEIPENHPHTRWLKLQAGLRGLSLEDFVQLLVDTAYAANIGDDTQLELDFPDDVSELLERWAIRPDLRHKLA